MTISTALTNYNRLRAVTQNGEALAQLQQQVASGKNWQRPSDNPQVMRESAAAKISIARTQRYLGMSDLATSRLNHTSSALSAVNSAMDKAREAAVTGAQGSLSQGDRNNLAHEIAQTLESLASLANSRDSGQYLFGGTQTATEPFAFTRNGANEIVAAQYRGNDSVMSLTIGDGETVAAGISGQTAFAESLATLIQLRDQLQNKAGLPEADQLTAISNSLKDIDRTTDNNLDRLTEIGGRLAYLEEKSLGHAAAQVAQQGEVSRLEDLDLPTAVVQLSERENAYRASVYLAAKPAGGLLDYLS